MATFQIDHLWRFHFIYFMYGENSKKYVTNNKNFSIVGQKVLAKRDIPLRRKFGPFVGDTKTLSKPEIKRYRETHSDYPLLFINHDTILDVSNESMFFLIKSVFPNVILNLFFSQIHRYIELDALCTFSNKASRSESFIM